MATEILKITDTPSGNIYFVVWNAAGEVFDFDDNEFKALGSAVEPYLVATERTGRGGVDESGYDAALDLALINTAPAIAVFTVEAYRRLGGAPVITTDQCLGDSELRIAAGSLVASGSPGEVPGVYTVRCGFNTTSTEGDVIQLYAWLEKNGQPVTLDVDDDECTFDLFEFGADVDVSTIGGPTDPVPPRNGQFEATVEGLTLTANTEYLLKVSLLVGGVTFTGQDSFPIVGSD